MDCRRGREAEVPTTQNDVNDSVDWTAGMLLVKMHRQVLCRWFKFGFLIFRIVVPALEDEP
jgi:hypothetical protein